MISRDRTARRIITVGAGKGGVGKSIIAANLAVVLAQRGRRVLLVDADLGAPNLHTILGVEHVRTGLDAFFARGGTLEAVSAPTSVPGLRLVCGAFQADAANLAAPLRRLLVEAVKDADADVVILDVGAGTGVTTVDLFLAADQRLLVMVPQLPSVQNAYLFLKAAIFQLLKQVAEAAGELAHLAEAFPNDVGKVLPGLTVLGAKRPAFAARLASILAGHGVAIIGNQIVDPEGVATIEAMRRMIRDYLAITPAVLGNLHASPAARTSIDERCPFALDAGAVRLTGELRSVTDKLLETDVAVLRAARAWRDERDPHARPICRVM